MQSARYVGRVGALAITLGIGAAVTLGHGVAWAEDSPGSEPGTSSSQSESGPETGTATAQTSPGQPRSPLRDGPLSRIADRMRKSVEDDAKSAVPRAESTGVTVGNGRSATGVPTSPTGGAKKSEAVEHSQQPSTPAEAEPDPTEPVEAAVEDVDAPRNTTPRPVGGPRPERETVLAADPRSRSNHRSERAAIRPASVSTLSEAAAPQRGTTAMVRVKEIPAATERGTAAITEAGSTITASAAQLPGSARQAVVTVPTADDVAEPVRTVPKLVSGVLAAVGLAPLAGTGVPTAPAQSPALWALMAWARREFDRTVNPAGQSAPSVVSEPTAALLVEPAAVAVIDPNQQTPAPAAPQVGQTKFNGWITGGTITDQWYVGGTDLGIMWDDGAGHVLTIFGDTFINPDMTGDWRNNVLLRSVDTNLSNGIQFDKAVISPGGVYADNEWWSPTPQLDRAGATQVIRDPGFLGLFGSTTTIIPTAAVEVDGVQYVNVMSVRTWDTPGRWTTNWSAIAYSDDGGLTWTVDRNTVRSSGWLRSSTPYVPGNQNFQQGAFVKAPEPDPETGINYVYSYGTPSGRGGSAYLARVPEGQIRNLGAYEYWAGDDRGWVANDPSAAVPVIGATDQSPPPSGFIGMITKAINDFLGGIVVGGLVGGNVSEMSVQYNEYLGQYVVLYTNAGNNVVMQVSDSPQGQWSDPTVLATSLQYPGLYAPMIHPWSGTDRLDGNDSILYWNLSLWGPYNVQMMQTDLSPMGPGSQSAGTIEV